MIMRDILAMYVSIFYVQNMWFGLVPIQLYIIIMNCISSRVRRYLGRWYITTSMKVSGSKMLAECLFHGIR